MGKVEDMVDSKIAGKKVMMFSKSGCPFCSKAKAIFKKYLGDVLKAEDYEVEEIDRSSDCEAIQKYMLKKTGGRSVSRILSFDSECFFWCWLLNRSVAKQVLFSSYLMIS